MSAREMALRYMDNVAKWRVLENELMQDAESALVLMKEQGYTVLADRAWSDESCEVTIKILRDGQKLCSVTRTNMDLREVMCLAILEVTQNEH